MATRRIMFFMTGKDEREFSTRLRAAWPSVTFIEKTQSASPNVVASIADASSRQVWIRADRVPEGSAWKSLGPMLLLTRSFQKNDLELREGEIAISMEGVGAHVKDFIASTWKVLRAMTTNHLATYNPVSGNIHKEVRDAHVAADASRWHTAGGLLHGNGANVYFKVLGDPSSHVESSTPARKGPGSAPGGPK